MRISNVIRRKGDLVVTVRSSDTVEHLIAILDEHRIGAVVVSDDDGATVAGIVSERDVVTRLHRAGADVLNQRVSQIMSTDVVTCTPDDGIEDLARTMTERRVRHIPVVVDGRLQAIVSIGDIVKHRLSELQSERDQLRDYISS